MSVAGDIPNNDEGFRRQMARFFEATTDAIFFLDRQYRFTFLNRRAHELLDSGGEDILGRVLFEKYPDTVYEGSPYVAAYTGSMDRGEIGDFEAYYPAPFDFWLRVQSYPSVDGIMVFFRDVTQDRRLQESLRRNSEEAERRLAEIETLYRTAPIGLALFDVDDYRYLRLNDLQASFFGLSPGEVVGKTLTEMAPIEGLQELFDKVAAGQTIVNYPLEGYLVTDPETLRYWTVNYFPVYAADGKVAAITAASLEITQQKKAEHALIESEKLAAVGRLAASIAHEINNPLEAVTNLLYLARSTENTSDIREYLRIADAELRRTSSIASQTLRFHKQLTRPVEVTCDELIGSVLLIHQSRIQNYQVVVEKRQRAQRPVLCFDGEVRQVLSNLVGNAVDALAGSNGKLLIRSREGHDWETRRQGILITVADTGHGMSESAKDKLFEAFFSTKGIAGTGLGLWISKEIVDRHRGKLRVRSSQSQGKSGTVFSMFLPFEAAIR